MRISVILFSNARKAVGLRDIDLELEDSSTVEDALDRMTMIYGHSFKEAIYDFSSNRYSMIFSLNKKLCSVNSRLKDGDILTIFPTAGGG